MTALVLQARLDSTRLPRKVLLPLGGVPMVQRVMETLRRISCDRYILACPEDSVSALEPPAAEAGFELFPGPKEDVLGRYCMVIRRFQIDRIIRATADNPFVFVDAAERINREAVELQADYAAYGGLPLGAGVESVSAEALLRAGRKASLPAEREHVCPYLYSYPGLFLLHRPLALRAWQGASMRISVDTRKDYERAQVLYDALASLPDSERCRGEVIIKTIEETLGPPDIPIMEYIN